ncbi:MAG: hypothetical protein ACFNVQ_07015 [Campylobacter sp.]
MIAKVWLKFLNFTAFVRETARGISAMRCGRAILEFYRKTISLKGAKRRMRGRIATREISWIERTEFWRRNFKI